MADPARARRLAKRISTIVASAIEYEIKDPRLAGVTITDAKVTADLHDATLYYTVLGATLEDEPDYPGAAAALESAKGVLRSKVGAGTGVRFASPRRWRSSATPSRMRPTAWKSCCRRCGRPTPTWRVPERAPPRPATPTPTGSPWKKRTSRTDFDLGSS